jgi:ABC-type uncharacterized transport system ATPase subunit
VIIDHGRSVAAGTPAALRRRIGGSVLEMTLARKPTAGLLETLRTASGVVNVSVDGKLLSVTYTEGDAAAAEVLNTVTAVCSLRQFVQRHTSLDEVFMRLTSADDGG